MSIKYILLTLLFSLPGYLLVAGQADSLLSAYNKEKRDTARVAILGLIIKEQVKSGATGQAKQTLHTMLLQAERSGNNIYRARACNSASFIYASEANPDSMLYYVDKALGFLKNEKGVKATEQKVMANNNAATAYSFSGNIKKSIDILIANIPLTQEISNNELYHLIIHNIASSFVMIGENELAYEYMLQSVALADKPESALRLQVLTYLNATVVCYNLKKFEAQKMYLDKAAKSLRLFGENSYWPQYYAYEAMYYSATGQAARALLSAYKALNESQKYDDRRNEYLAYEALRDAYAALKNYDKAKAAAQRLYEMGIKDKYPEAIIDAAKSLAGFARKKGNYREAYQYLEQYTLLKDSVQSRENMLKINELETLLHTSQKEEKIVHLELEKRKAALQMKDQKLTNALLGISAGVLLLTSLYLYTIYRNNKQKQSYKLRELQQQKELQVTQAVLEGEEQERQRIARELHDGLGGTLSGIKIKLTGVQKRTDMPVLDETIHQLENSIGELRRIARNLMPETLIRSGLEIALRDLCVAFSTDHTRLEYQSSNIDKNIPLPAQAHIYRIIQELLSNSIRHGNASEILVQCIQNGHRFLITVEDNGTGFNPLQIRTRKGMGIDNIKSRVSMMKGTINIESAPGAGTTINIELYV